MADKPVVYGIANCDTVRKARQWLKSQGIEHDFHDYKKAGIDKLTLTRFSQVLGWENLLNKRGTTWRKLPENLKADLTQARAIDLMMENTSVIKRPIVDTGDTLLLGFEEAPWSTALKS